MTYLQKAEQLLMAHFGVSNRAAADIIQLIDTEGEYTPRVMPVLNAPEDAEDWDGEIPE